MSTPSEALLLGLIGDGITRSLTPPMQEREAAEHGIDLLYRPVDTAALGLTGAAAADALPELLRWGQRLGFNGFNITHPFKQMVLDLLDEVEDSAARLGAVNTVVFAEDGRRVGYNTDFTGYLRGLRATVPDADLSEVVQLGVGGAGAAVAFALLQEGAEHLRLVDLDLSRAQERAASLQGLFPDAVVTAAPKADLEDVLASATGFAHCTPVGMHHHPGTPVDIERIPDSAWVSDVVYLPLETELVAAARGRGLRVADGGGMAVGQAVDAFTLFTGREPDAGRMARHFAELTGQETA
jgi:shikimate dehydrogenase